MSPRNGLGDGGLFIFWQCVADLRHSGDGGPTHGCDVVLEGRLKHGDEGLVGDQPHGRKQRLARTASAWPAVSICL